VSRYSKAASIPAMHSTQLVDIGFNYEDRESHLKERGLGQKISDYRSAVSALSRQGDVVLGPFCGSLTGKRGFFLVAGPLFSVLSWSQ
jgi:hypothetical protein